MRRLVCLLTFILLALIVPPVKAETLTVSAAISLKDALETIARSFEQQQGGTVQLNFGASGQLLEQIRNGAPVDLFISASPDQIQTLIKQDLCDRQSRQIIAQNRLVVIVPSASIRAISHLQDLAGKKIQRIAVGNPKIVPAGEYARQTLEYFHLADAVRDRLIYAANVRQVLDYVRRGEVDAGFVYATDVPIAGKQVKVAAAVPDESHQPILYEAVVIRPSSHSERAARFLNYLLTPDSQAVFRSRGFSPPATRPSHD